jgi:short-subunit dehydrogenase
LNIDTKNYYGVVAITGASSGLGAAMAKLIAPKSKAIILIGRTKEKLLKVKNEVSAANPKMLVHPIVCDLTFPEHRKRLIDDLSKLKLDTLILNAGSGIFKKFTEARFVDHMRTIELNITATVDIMYHLLPTLDPRCRVQVISSHSSEIRVPHFSVYAAAKTFLTLWAETLAIELKQSKLTFSIICAGAMETEFGHRAGIPKMVSKIASPEEIAGKCIRLLDKPGTHYLTIYDKMVWAINRFLPRCLVDFLISWVQRRYIK